VSTDPLALPDTPGAVVILTGPPGAGKSTVAELLARQSDRPTARRRSDPFGELRIATTSRQSSVPAELAWSIRTGFRATLNT